MLATMHTRESIIHVSVVNTEFTNNSAECGGVMRVTSLAINFASIAKEEFMTLKGYKQPHLWF